MNNLQIFNNNQFGEIRTAVLNNEPYFMLADVCRVLEINNPSQAKSRLSEYGVISNEVIDSVGRTQQATFINESNLYKLAFTSRKKEAEGFTDWVTGEVLPQIRKTGVYGQMVPQTLPEALRAYADEVEAHNKSKVLLEAQKPKVLFADAVSTSHTSILIGDLAKLLKQNGYETGQKRLFEQLRQEGYLIKSGSSCNMPTQKSMDLGLFEVKETTVQNSDGSVRITKTTKVTGKGQLYFINRYLQEKAS